MSALDLIPASSAMLGEGMPIRRALPTQRRRLIGAWCFLDHFGPADVSHSAGMRVGPHPHLGLQTVTWLLRGEVLHRDSLGSVQLIRPGALNLMTAGRGISHSEESPAHHSPEIHGLQFWIALPEQARTIAPSFVHYPKVPRVKHGGASITVLAGDFLGAHSPAKVHTPLVGLSITAPAGASVTLPLRPEFEYGAIVMQGAAQVAGEHLAPGTLLYLGSGVTQVEMRIGATDTALALVGGEPLAEPVLMWWNFVAREKTELSAAVRDWNAHADYFGDVVGYDGARLVAPMPPWPDA